MSATDPRRRSSVVLGGILLAALFSGADIAGPTAAAAQTSAAHRVLLGQFDPGFDAAAGGSTSHTAGASDGRIPSPERALLGKVEAGQAEKQGQEEATERRGFIGPVAPRGGEQALLGRGAVAAS